jgi:hypothetical protein
MGGEDDKDKQIARWKWCLAALRKREGSTPQQWHRGSQHISSRHESSEVLNLHFLRSHIVRQPQRCFVTVAVVAEYADEGMVHLRETHGTEERESSVE